MFYSFMFALRMADTNTNSYGQPTAVLAGARIAAIVLSSISAAASLMVIVSYIRVFRRFEAHQRKILNATEEEATAKADPSNDSAVNSTAHHHISGMAVGHNRRTLHHLAPGNTNNPQAFGGSCHLHCFSCESSLATPCANNSFFSPERHPPTQLSVSEAKPMSGGGADAATGGNNTQVYRSSMPPLSHAAAQAVHPLRKSNDSSSRATSLDRYRLASNGTANHEPQPLLQLPMDWRHGSVSIELVAKRSLSSASAQQHCEDSSGIGILPPRESSATSKSPSASSQPPPPHSGSRRRLLHYPISYCNQIANAITAERTAGAKKGGEQGGDPKRYHLQRLPRIPSSKIAILSGIDLLMHLLWIINTTATQTVGGCTATLFFYQWAQLFYMFFLASFATRWAMRLRNLKTVHSSRQRRANMIHSIVTLVSSLVFSLLPAVMGNGTSYDSRINACWFARNDGIALRWLWMSLDLWVALALLLLVAVSVYVCIILSNERRNLMSVIAYPTPIHVAPTIGVATLPARPSIATTNTYALATAAHSGATPHSCARSSIALRMADASTEHTINNRWSQPGNMGVKAKATLRDANGFAAHRHQPPPVPYLLTAAGSQQLAYDSSGRSRLALHRQLLPPPSSSNRTSITTYTKSPIKDTFPPYSAGIADRQATTSRKGYYFVHPAEISANSSQHRRKYAKHMSMPMPQSYRCTSNPPPASGKQRIHDARNGSSVLAPSSRSSCGGYERSACGTGGFRCSAHGSWKKEANGPNVPAIIPPTHANVPVPVGTCGSQDPIKRGASRWANAVVGWLVSCLPGQHHKDHTSIMDMQKLSPGGVSGLSTYQHRARGQIQRIERRIHRLLTTGAVRVATRALVPLITQLCMVAWSTMHSLGNSTTAASRQIHRSVKDGEEDAMYAAAVILLSLQGLLDMFLYYAFDTQANVSEVSLQSYFPSANRQYGSDKDATTAAASGVRGFFDRSSAMSYAQQQPSLMHLPGDIYYSGSRYSYDTQHQLKHLPSSIYRKSPLDQQHFFPHHRAAHHNCCFHHKPSLTSLTGNGNGTSSLNIRRIADRTSNAMQSDTLNGSDCVAWSHMDALSIQDANSISQFSTTGPPSHQQQQQQQQGHNPHVTNYRPFSCQHMPVLNGWEEADLEEHGSPG
ncbi:hypothetical protein GGI22_000516 [Coemansia erecta]|nr:hypothetical protein GGI22_000516 [Coemansia erecta]